MFDIYLRSFLLDSSSLMMSSRVRFLGCGSLGGVEEGLFWFANTSSRVKPVSTRARLLSEADISSCIVVNLRRPSISHKYTQICFPVTHSFLRYQFYPTITQTPTLQFHSGTHLLFHTLIIVEEKPRILIACILDLHF